MTNIDRVRIAVLIPCYNEEVAVARVVYDFREALPKARIYVFDNNSTDATRTNALAAGAIVRHVSRPGKGNVVRRMFADVDADIYVLVDGDATYHAASARSLVDKLVEEDLDMVVGTRVHEHDEAYRRGHQFGNRLLTGAMTRIFGGSFTDMLSGYRVFSRRFAKSFPAMSRGFEIETELTIHALELRMPYGESATPYGARPDGSTSKLSTYSDGMRILSTIIKLFGIERPLQFYGVLAGVLAAVALVFGIPLFLTYLESGLVPRFPTAILSTGLVMLSAISFVTGVILETVTIGRREVKQLHYLAIGSPSCLSGEDESR
ncbi:MAG: glycosyltransferase family 2 protein [Thiobacillus sp.]